MAKIYRVPFSLISQSRLISSVPALVSKYRKTPFSIQDGFSEWKGNGYLHIAEYNGSLAGIMRLDERRTCWGLSSFIVNEDLRGCGIGNALLNSINFLDKPVYLKVQQDNPAIHLYKRHNFKTIEKLDGRYNMVKTEFL